MSNTIQCESCGAIIDLPEPEERDWKADALEIMKHDPNAPSEDQLEEWKHKHGNIFFLPLNKTQFYIYRPVTGTEYEEMVASMLKHVGKDDTRMQEKTLNELVCYRCTLYPKITPETKKSLSAGTIPSLSHMIHLMSNFCDPSQLSNLIYEL